MKCKGIHRPFGPVFKTMHRWKLFKIITEITVLVIFIFPVKVNVEAGKSIVKPDQEHINTSNWTGFEFINNVFNYVRNSIKDFRCFK